MLGVMSSACVEEGCDARCLAITKRNIPVRISSSIDDTLRARRSINSSKNSSLEARKQDVKEENGINEAHGARTQFRCCLAHMKAMKVNGVGRKRGIAERK